MYGIWVKLSLQYVTVTSYNKQLQHGINTNLVNLLLKEFLMKYIFFLNYPTLSTRRN